MSCTLTVRFEYVASGSPGSETHDYSVPDDSYVAAYKVNRPDLGYNGSSNKVYDARSTGSQGEITLQTFYPTSIDVSITKVTNSCSISHDCINGNCVPSTTYHTPGIYTSLSDCQAVCANGGACAAGKQCVDPTTFCPDGKVCIDQGEFSSIEALISKIGSEVC